MARRYVELEEVIGAEWLSAGAYWFAGGTRRLDALLDQFGYERTGRCVWDLAKAGHGWSLVLVPTFCHDSQRETTVVVMGLDAYRDFANSPVANPAVSEGG